LFSFSFCSFSLLIRFFSRSTGKRFRFGAGRSTFFFLPRPSMNNNNDGEIVGFSCHSFAFCVGTFYLFFGRRLDLIA